MITPSHLREHVIRPVLTPIGLWSQAAEDLLVGTAAVESRMGTFLVQVGGGPAKGIYQMEPNTHSDIWENWLRYRPKDEWQITQRLAPYLWDSVAHRPSHHALVVDLAYATIMARLHYRRAPDPLPVAGDLMAMAAYHKKFYNTSQGKTGEGDFIKACEECGVARARVLTNTVGE